MAKLTRRTIVYAFMDLLQIKSLDKITVKDVIESAEINRNTCYYHFKDIFDLLDYTFQNESDKFRSEYNPANTFYGEYIRLVDFLQEHREAIIHIYNSNSRDVLNRYLESSIGHFVSLFVKKSAEGTSLTDEGEEYITSFYTYAIIGSTKRWIERKMPNYKDGLAKTISNSFESTIKEMILSYISGQQKDSTAIKG